MIVSQETALLVARMEPKIEALFRRYRIPGENRGEILEPALAALDRQRDSVRDRPAWLLGALRRNCLLYWRGQGRRIYAIVGPYLIS